MIEKIKKILNEELLDSDKIELIKSMINMEHSQFEQQKDSNVVNPLLCDVLSEIKECAWTAKDGERYVFLEQLENLLGKYFH